MRTLICLNMGNGGRVISGCVFFLGEIPGVCVCVCVWVVWVVCALYVPMNVTRLSKVPMVM